jgi:hypothetical protein
VPAHAGPSRRSFGGAYVEVTRQTNEILPDCSSAKHTDPAKKRLGAGINIEDALCQRLTSIQFLDLPKPPATLTIFLPQFSKWLGLALPGEAIVNERWNLRDKRESAPLVSCGD